MYVMELTKEISGGRGLKHSDGSPACSENDREHSPPDTEQVRGESPKRSERQGGRRSGRALSSSHCGAFLHFIASPFLIWLNPVLHSVLSLTLPLLENLLEQVK